MEVGGTKPSSLADLFRRIWACGNAGTRVPLRLLRETSTKEVSVQSADRGEFLKKPHLH
jgi:S1-C subfamily serine protease